MGDLEVVKKHLAKLPKMVKIGGYRWKVELAPYDDPDLEGDYGCTNLETMRITVADTLDFQKLVNTLKHELNHAINHTFGLEDSSSEEDYARLTANGWVNLRVENPKMDRWLNRAIFLLRKIK